MTTLTVDIQGFKQVVADFCRSLPVCTSADSLEAGLKCVNLSYLGIEPIPVDDSPEQAVATSYLQYAHYAYHRQAVILASPPPAFFDPECCDACQAELECGQIGLCEDCSPGDDQYEIM